MRVPSLHWLGLLALLAWISGAVGVAANPVRTDNAEASLVGELATAQAGTPFAVALRLKMRPGWHTYWLNPGDSGQATSLAWTLPDGFTAGAIEWPAPHRIPVGPLMNYGYEGEVLLLTRITPPVGYAGPAELRAQAEWLVCEKICIPEEAALALTLPVGPGAAVADPGLAQTFRNAVAALPQPSPWPARFAAGAGSLGLRFEAPGLQAGELADVWFFATDPVLIQHAAPQRLAVDRAGFGLTIQRTNFAVAPDRLDGVLSVTQRIDGRTTHHAFVVAAPPGAMPAATERAAMEARSLPLWEAALLALLGGVILNLMPCVFPVLAMKALGFARHGQGKGGRDDKGHLAAGGLAYTAGVLLAFAFVAGLLIALRAGGAEIGWGFQLQSPGFVTLAALVMFAVGLSLSGVFTFGGAWVGVGGGLTRRTGYAGSFFTGVLAAVVASPCTAPFMGAAVGFALTQPWYMSLAVFQALGLGLALPYLALSLSPGLLRFLPRPGLWMERFKQVMAFPMYATSAWLVWVLSQQAGPDGVMAALGGMVILGFAAWLFEATRAGSRGWRVAGMTGAVAATMIALALAGLPASEGPLPARAATAEGATAEGGSGPRFEPFSPERLAEARAAGRPVFVNFTAAWCITCLVNERMALATADVVAGFAEKGVVYLKGDWTNRDPAITRVLASFGRSGVPLYVLYPSAASGREAMVLPQILTKAIVLDEVLRL